LTSKPDWLVRYDEAVAEPYRGDRNLGEKGRCMEEGGGGRGDRKHGGKRDK